MTTIFVLIASYRDPECRTTVQDLFENAALPERVSIGICWQFDPSDPFDCIYGDQSFPGNIRIERVPHKQSNGVCWARHRASQLVKNEAYVLTIDSHTLFEPGWDITFLEELSSCPSKRAILSAYPAGYTLPRKKRYPPPNVNSAHWHRLRYEAPGDQFPEGNIRGNNDYLLRRSSYDEPVRAAFFAAGCTFMPAQALRQVPFDPYLDWDEEEISYSARLWSYGWNLYAPRRHLVHHLYAKNRSAEGSYNFRRHTENDQLYKRFVRSKRRYFHIIGAIQSEAPDALVELKRYGLGTARSLRAFEAFAGIYLKQQRVSIRGYRTWFAAGSSAHPLNNKVGDDELYKAMRNRYLQNGSMKLDPGSTQGATRVIASSLRGVMETYRIGTILDIPCGASSWILQAGLRFKRYIGGDFVPELVEERRRAVQKDTAVRFEQLDIRSSVLGAHDLIFVRDCLTHFCYEDVVAALQNLKRSGSKYLMASHYAKLSKNNGVKSKDGMWHRLDLTPPPYNLPEPIEIVDDQPDKEKYMALWRVADLPDVLPAPTLRAETIFDRFCSFDETEYLFSLRHADCHREQEYFRSISVDVESMRRCSVFESIQRRIEMLFCLDGPEMRLDYFSASEGSLDIPSSCVLVALLLPGWVLTLRTADSTVALTTGSALAFRTVGRVNFELQSDDKISEWGIAVVSTKEPV